METRDSDRDWEGGWGGRYPEMGLKSQVFFFGSARVGSS